MATRLSELPGFIPCKVGERLAPELERAMLPGLDGVLREIARGLREQTISTSSHSMQAYAEQEPS